MSFNKKIFKDVLQLEMQKNTRDRCQHLWVSKGRGDKISKNNRNNLNQLNSILNNINRNI